MKKVLANILLGIIILFVQVADGQTELCRKESSAKSLSAISMAACVLPCRAFILRKDSTMPLTLKKEDAAWLAAIIDGEGCIGINRTKKQDRPNYMFMGFVRVYNTNKNLISKCRQLTQSGSISLTTKNRRKPLYRWHVATKQAVDVLVSIYPYLIAKKEQAKVLIALQKHNHKRSFNRAIKGRRGNLPLTTGELKIKTRFWQYIKELNQR